MIVNLRETIYNANKKIMDVYYLREPQNNANSQPIIVQPKSQLPKRT